LEDWLAGIGPVAVLGKEAMSYAAFTVHWPALRLLSEHEDPQESVIENSSTTDNFASENAFNHVLRLRK
jgi:hypothetical protein